MLCSIKYNINTLNNEILNSELTTCNIDKNGRSNDFVSYRVSTLSYFKE